MAGAGELIKWDEQWAEALALLFVFVGFLVSILLMNSVITYFSVVLAGFMAGRIYYVKKHHQPILPFILMILGFLLGYVLGNFWASRLWTLIFFIVGFMLSLHLHHKKILGIFKSDNFIK